MPRPNTLYQQLLLDLRRLIRASVAPGHTIPSQRTLADMHGVGQATVHRALHELAREGLVRPQPRKGWMRTGRKQSTRTVGSRQGKALRIGVITRRSHLELAREAPRQMYGSIREEAERRGIEVLFVTNPRVHHPTPARNRLELERVPWNEFDVALLIEVEDRVTLSDPMLQEHRVLAVDQDARCFGINSVSFDDYGGGTQAARHLLELGHQRFSVTEEVNDSGWPQDSTWSARRHGFEDTVGRWGYGLHPEWRMPTGRRRNTPPRDDIVKRFARTMASAPTRLRPTALFAIDSSPIRPLMRELARHDILVPRDLSIVTATWNDPDDLRLQRARNRTSPRSDADGGYERMRFTTVQLDLPLLLDRAIGAAEELAAGEISAEQKRTEAPRLITAPATLLRGTSTAVPPTPGEV